MIAHRDLDLDRDGLAGALVTLASRELEVTLLGHGAAIHRVRAPDGRGAVDDVHLWLPRLADHLDQTRNQHLGATAGRYANRIAGARFDLGGRPVRLTPNDGPNQLHGGPDGFGRRVWDLTRSGDHGDAGASATFMLVSPDGDQGFPGTLTATVTYEVSGADLRITTEAETDAPTVVNLCNHGYWNLDLARGAEGLGDHRLTVAAGRYLPVDGAGIPIDDLAPVEGTPFDLRRPRRLGDVADEVSGGLDHCLAPDGATGPIRTVARLEAPARGRWLEVATDQPGLQVYTADHLGEPWGPRWAVCLEAQRFPDTPNRPALGSARLDPGDTYRTTTELRFGTGGLSSGPP